MKAVVKRSAIHGKGLFSAKFIAEGTIIGECKTRDIQQPNSYTLWTDGRAVEIRCKLKYVNHSDTPNVAYCDDFTVVALENIPKGEELTHNYESDD